VVNLPVHGLIGPPKIAVVLFMYFLQIPSAYRLLATESFPEFRYHMFQQRSLSEICPAVGDGLTCPTCPKVLEVYLIDVVNGIQHYNIVLHKHRYTQWRMS